MSIGDDEGDEGEEGDDSCWQVVKVLMVFT
jgi:hypothetical protein